MSTSKKEGLTFGAVRRINVPPVMVDEAEMTIIHNGIEVLPSSMIVFTDASDPGATRKLKFFCKKNALDWTHLEHNSFNVVGLYDALLRLTDCLYVREFHWDIEAKVFNASGAGEKPKRVKTHRMLPTTDEGVAELQKQAEQDAAHIGAGKPIGPIAIHGDTTLDKIEVQKRRDAELWWKQNGLSVPVVACGPDGKAL